MIYWNNNFASDDSLACNFERCDFTFDLTVHESCSVCRTQSCTDLQIRSVANFSSSDLALVEHSGRGSLWERRSHLNRTDLGSPKPKWLLRFFSPEPVHGLEDDFVVPTESVPDTHIGSGNLDGTLNSYKNKNL